MTKNIVINADDFGISVGVNSAIEMAYRGGIVRSASLISTGPEFKSAIKIAKRNPGLGIGTHLSLTWGTSVLDKNTIPDLVDPDNYFYSSPFALAVKVFIKKGTLLQIEREFEAQIKKVLDNDISLDHIDSQAHVHFLPQVFPIVVALAKKYKINHVRIPLEPLFSPPPPSGLIKWGILQIMGKILSIQGQLPKKYPTFYGVLFTGNMKKKIIKKIILYQKSGNNIEILSHPGEKKLSKTKFLYSKQKIDSYLFSKNRYIELKVLANGGLISFIKKQEVNLCSFKKLIL